MKLLVQKINLILLILIFTLGVILRFYKIDTVPNGLYQDETAIGYNAYSILKDGRDEYGKKYPLYFKSFGDQKLPVYIYSAVVSETIFGVNAFAVRFPSAFFGSLTILVLFLFVRILTKNTKIALVSSFLYSINPWSLHYNRATFEVSICLFLFALGGYLLVKSFKSKKFGLFLAGTVFFVLCLYSYNLTRLLSPLFFGSLLFIYRKYLKQISRNELLITICLAGLMLVPFALSILDSGGANSAKGTLIFSSNAVRAPILEFKSYFIYEPLLSKLFLNSYFQIFWQYLNNVVAYFSISFFFINGSYHGNHGIGNFGLFYLFEFPMIILGGILAYKRKQKGFNLLFIWAALTILVAALTRDIPQATRSFFLVIPLVVFSGMGLLSTLDYISKINNYTKKILIILPFLFVIIYSIAFYFLSYYFRFPTLYAKSWKSEDKLLVEYIAQNESKYKKIIFDKKAGFVYTSLLFYSKYNPEEFYNNVKRLPDDEEGFSQVESFGKYEFRDVDWTKDYINGNLIITNRDNKPSEFPVLQTFDYPLRPVVVSLKEKLFEFPVVDNAYVLLEKK